MLASKKSIIIMGSTEGMLRIYCIRPQNQGRNYLPWVDLPPSVIFRAVQAPMFSISAALSTLFTMPAMTWVVIPDA